jgi:hypothetical protein
MKRPDLLREVVVDPDVSTRAVVPRSGPGEAQPSDKNSSFLRAARNFGRALTDKT